MIKYFYKSLVGLVPTNFISQRKEQQLKLFENFALQLDVYDPSVSIS